MLAGRRIALVEDDEIMGASIAQRLVLEGAEVVWHKQAVRALGAIRTPRAPIDAVVCDIRLPDGTGEDVFLALCRTAAPPPFLFITGQGDVAQAVRLLKAGAADYVTKPFEMRAFLDRLAQLVGPPDVDGPSSFGVSPAARDVERRLADLADGDAPTLILGSAGTGKARLARRLHDLSRRRAAPFLDCDLRAEGALFDSSSVAKEAAGGTLHLAGLDAMSHAAQETLVRLLDEGASFRLVTSAGPGLGPVTEGGALRADLWGRLAGGSISIPPLAARPEDALWLARQIFGAVNARRMAPLRGISTLAEAAILDHPWPGNGREVRTRVVQAVAAASGEWLFPTDLFPEHHAPAQVPLRPLSEIRDAAERTHISTALERSGGHMAEAARLLNVSRTTLWEKMQKLGL